MNIESIIVMINQVLGQFVHQGSSQLSIGLLNLGLI